MDAPVYEHVYNIIPVKKYALLLVLSSFFATS